MLALWRSLPANPEAKMGREMTFEIDSPLIPTDHEQDGLDVEGGCKKVCVIY
jgi:hypothetical protein